MENTSLKLPEFMDQSTVLEKGGVVENVGSGNEATLNAVEMTVYMAIKKAERTASKMDSTYLESLDPDDANPQAVPYWDLVRSGTDWFKNNNPDAYMRLLD